MNTLKAKQRSDWRMRGALFAGAVGCLAMLDFAHATSFLVGAQVFAYRASNGSLAQGYQYSTNTGTGDHQFLDLDRQGDLTGPVNQAISIALQVGDSAFDWSGTIDAPLGIFNGTNPAYGLNLFFNSTGASFNPTNPAGSSAGFAGDLTVKATEGSSAFTVPDAGSDIAGYNWNNAILSTAGVDLAFPVSSANGQTGVLLGSHLITIKSFSVLARDPDALVLDPRGQFTLSVTPVPEPKIYVTVLAGLALIAMAARRRAA